MTWTHGKPSTYKRGGCRCDACTEANTIFQRDANRRRAERLARGDANPQHGTAATYNNWGCRCDACVRAHADDCQMRAAVRRRLRAGATS